MNKKERNTLLEEFKKAQPKLVELNPQITISEILEHSSSEHPGVFTFNPPIVEIVVRHPFVFDNRLVPEEFKGFEVKNIPFGNYPIEFPSEDCEYPQEYYNSIEHYVKFVNNNILFIRKELKKPKLNKLEALDAITGGFNKLIQENIRYRKERIQDEKENMAFFFELLYEINQTYFLSGLYHKYKNKKWYYALTSTRLVKNRPLIIGLNWIVDKRKTKKFNRPQTEYPLGHFNSYYEDLGSYKKTIKYFYKYYPKGLYGTHTSLCFFRAEKESDVSNRDIELCLPILKKLITYLKPSCIISFTDKFPELIENKVLFDKTIMVSTEIHSKNKTLNVSKGIATFNNYKMGVYNLPHPNSSISSNARNKAWKYCFD